MITLKVMRCLPIQPLSPNHFFPCVLCSKGGKRRSFKQYRTIRSPFHHLTQRFPHIFNLLSNMSRLDGSCHVSCWTKARLATTQQSYCCSWSRKFQFYGEQIPWSQHSEAMDGVGSWNCPNSDNSLHQHTRSASRATCTTSANRPLSSTDPTQWTA